MKQIHIECRPDECLVRKIGFLSKNITHHQGKSRVFNALIQSKNHLALVDEDPGSIKHPYESELTYLDSMTDLQLFQDRNDNIIVVIKPKLEDWIIRISRESKIDIRKYGLPDDPDDLHDQINNKLRQFENLLDDLKDIRNSPLNILKTWLR